MVHVKDAVDLRPSRPSVRLEKEDMPIKCHASRNATLKVISYAGSLFCYTSFYMKVAYKKAVRSKVKFNTGCLRAKKVDFT